MSHGDEQENIIQQVMVHCATEDVHLDSDYRKDPEAVSEFSQPRQNMPIKSNNLKKMLSKLSASCDDDWVKKNINTCLTAIWKIYTKRLVMLCKYTDCSSRYNTKPTVHCSVPNNDLPKSCIICSQPNKPSPGFIANFCCNCSFYFIQILRVGVLAAAFSI